MINEIPIATETIATETKTITNETETIDKSLVNPETVVNAMPASKMMTRAMLRASRSSAETDPESKVTKAAEFDTELDQPLAVQESAKEVTDSVQVEAGPDAKKEAEALPAAAAETTVDHATTEACTDDACGSEAAIDDVTAKADDADEAEVKGTQAGNCESAEIVDAEATHQPSSQPNSKKRTMSQMTGAAEIAAEEAQAAATLSKRSSKRLRLNDGTMATKADLQVTADDVVEEAKAEVDPVAAVLS